MARMGRIPRIIAATLAALCATAARALEEVPYITTPDSVTMAMLQMARVNAQDFVIDLGSGDGRIVIAAAGKFGARGLGVEIDPTLVKKSRDNAVAAGVPDRVEFREEDLFKTDLERASVITMYLLPDVNMELRPKLLALKPGVRVVSHDWDMGDWTPDRTLTLDVPDKPIGREKVSRVHLWIVPARIPGAWCSTGRSKGVTLDLDQKFQQVRGSLVRGAARHSFDARLWGPRMTSVDGNLVLDYDGTRLKPVVARNAFSKWKGMTFTRRVTDSCP